MLYKEKNAKDVFIIPAEDEEVNVCGFIIHKGYIRDNLSEVDFEEHRSLVFDNFSSKVPSLKSFSDRQWLSSFVFVTNLSCKRHG